MLPVVDKPAIQYVVEEAVAAGLDRRAAWSPAATRRRSRTTSTATASSRRRWRRRATSTGSRRVRESSVSRRPSTTSARATRAGLGHAVLCAAQHVGDEPFAVLLGDDLIDARDPLLTHDARRASAARRQRRRADGGAAATRSTSTAAPPSRPTDEAGRRAHHRPGREAAGRRGAEQPRDHRPLRARPRGLRRPAQDRARAAAARSSSPTPCAGWLRGGRARRPVHGVVFRGRRYDTGDRLDYLKAVVRLAGERDDLGPDFRAWLKRLRRPRSSAGDRPEDRRPAPRPTSCRHRRRWRRWTCSCSTRTAASWPRTSRPTVDLPPFDNSSHGRLRRAARRRAGGQSVGHRSCCPSSATSPPARRPPTPCSPGCACAS